MVRCSWDEYVLGDDFKENVRQGNGVQNVAIVKIPKTIDLFELYLQHATLNLKQSSTVVCAFMTKHFTKAMIEVAERYFNRVEQSRAVKKARLIILSDKKMQLLKFLY